MAEKKDAVPMEEKDLFEDAKDLVIQADANVGTIEDNFELLKASVANQVARYVGKKFDDTEIIEAKKDRASLNAMIKDLNERRMVIKRKWNEPLAKFEDRVKEVIGVIEKPLGEIDNQIKDYEERVKAEKQAEINTFIIESLDKEEEKLVRDIGVEFDERWLNVSMSMKKVHEAIEDQISRTRQDIATIRSLCKADKDEEILSMLLVSYKRTANLAQVIEERGEILAQREALEKEKARLEELRKAEEERLKAEADAAAQEPLEVQVDDVVDVGHPEAPEVEEELAATPEDGKTLAQIIFRFDCVLTSDQVKDLGAWLNSLGARYRMVAHVPYSEERWNLSSPKKEGGK